MPQEGEQESHDPFQPCPEREQFLKKAASARREYQELKRKLGTLIGTEEDHAINRSERAALHKAEMAVNEYLNHAQKHGC
jgi:predicted metal-binding transcription factor (methanogenesis marker protein 9)